MAITLTKSYIFYINDTKNDSSSLRTSISYKIICPRVLCYYNASGFIRGMEGELSVLMKWRISWGVLLVKGYLFMDCLNIIYEGAAFFIPFFKFFFLSFTIFLILRKNFCACDLTWALVLPSTSFSIICQFLPCVITAVSNWSYRKGILHVLTRSNALPLTLHRCIPHFHARFCSFMLSL